MPSPRGSGARRVAALAGAALAAGLLLAACGSSGDAEGQQACSDVATSLRLYAQGAAAAAAGDASLASSRYTSALVQLRLALPLAARAANASGQWQPLMATLGESNRVSEKYLVQALSAQCSIPSTG